jgi:arginase
VRVALIQVPYFLGREEVSWGAGPRRLAEAGAAEALSAAGHEVDEHRVQREGNGANEVGASFEVLRLVAEQVAAAVGRGALPVVVAGNCMTTIGVVAGLGTADVGVVWLDAHPDFNTPEETVGGHLDAMSLSILTGSGWEAIRATIPGYRPVPEENVVLAGMRDAEAAERRRLEAARIALVPPGKSLRPALDALRRRVEEVHLHLDLDVLDPSEGRANEYAADGGLTRADVETAIEAVRDRFRIRSAAMTAYDPELDPEGALARKAVELLVEVAEAGAVQRTSLA